MTDDEKLKFVPFMRHLSEVVHSFNERSLSVCVHSLVASQLLYPPRSTRGQRTASGGEGGSIKKAQKTLIEQLARAVESRATLQERAPCGFDAQEISNLLWALAKLVENGLLQMDQGGLVSQTVTSLLPKVVTPPGPFKPQEISNLLWALAKLVENRLLQLDQGFLASQAVTALLPQVVTPPGPFKLSKRLQPAVGAGETGGQRTTPAGSGLPGQSGCDSTVAASGDPSGTV